MFEHVGLPHYDEFFRRVAELLNDDGVALLHTIGNTGVPVPTNAWVVKNIFPGGYIPSLSEIVPAIERAGLMISDVEILRIHYAETLRCWRERFLARRDEAKAIMDERFCRMWEFYLAISEASFRLGITVIFQIQLVKKVDALGPDARLYRRDRKEFAAKREGFGLIREAFPRPHLEGAPAERVSKDESPKSCGNSRLPVLRDVRFAGSSGRGRWNLATGERALFSPPNRLTKDSAFEKRDREAAANGPALASRASSVFRRSGLRFGAKNASKQQSRPVAGPFGAESGLSKRRET